MNDRVVKLTVAYDGTDFCGWQRQAGVRTVQEEIESALAIMHGHPVPIVGAGRTDSGVHAAGQVAHFVTDIARIPADRFEPALNRLMPRDVRIVRAADAHPDFHARFDARLRRYRYHIRTGPAQLPHQDRYAWRIFHRPDLARLNRLAACLRGEIDCGAFAAAKDPSQNRSRYLHHAVFSAEGDGLVFDIAANAFLWRMVRSLVGTLVELEASGAPETAMRGILESGDRNRAGTTAPARGLFLWNVEYYDPPTRAGRRPCASAGEDAPDDE
ncbi:MAG: tRNA pseudouridine(38-40) synthase TruA [Spirochaetae bacterium HGW-Spirochaetae-7]|jgi:tRNA pseudouridine38-40 synthase|nr:MAG: tRNA pseudouridine(38-40) synthase TruA [Spirochaetae bacterium HGW-Spirochaetae-7]